MAADRRISSGLLYTQGLLVILPGLYGLVKPDEFVEGDGHVLTGKPTYLGHAMSMTSLIGLGAGFSVIASGPSWLHRRSFLINIPLRLLAAFVFWRSRQQGSRNVALWEVVWAGVNAAGLAFV